ncbi:MAG: hypothetical protein J5789_10030 [Oscillospiraceae bacterium]|nr:hypothetical protein [Oscillospiraceae bacterium]
MKLFGNNKLYMPDGRDSGTVTENPGTSDRDLETDALLRELEAVLDIPQKEKTDSVSPFARENEKEALSGETKVLPAVKEAEKAAETENEPAKEKAKDEPISAVSYASMAKAVEKAKKESTGRFSRNAVDDDNLLAELHALIGDTEKPKPRSASPFAPPSGPRSAPASRPAARITPETLKDVQEDYDDVAEADTLGVPGWIKGLFILLISLLLGAMTFYAVASDVIGEIF